MFTALERKFVRSIDIEESDLLVALADYSLDMLIVESVSDLLPYANGDEYILPAKLVMVNGNVDLGDKAIRISTNTVLRGLANATFISTNTNGVIRATNVDSAVIIREVNVVCFTGPCYVLTGTIEHQLNMFFCGMFGIKAGIITGFDVQSVKQCFIKAADGITCKGETNKVFISQSPFYDITGSAITLASDLVADVVDIVTSYFKFDSPGVGITAETGYSIAKGKFRGTLMSGTAIPLVGMSSSDLNWSMNDNTGVRNSRFAGGFYLTSSATTTFPAANTPVKIAGTVAGLAMNERFEVIGSRMYYRGEPPLLATVTGTVFIDTGNNIELNLYIAKSVRDGSGAITGIAVVPETLTKVFVGSGQDRRQTSVFSLIELLTDDYIELWIENTVDTTSMTASTLVLNAS